MPAIDPLGRWLGMPNDERRRKSPMHVCHATSSAFAWRKAWQNLMHGRHGGHAENWMGFWTQQVLGE